MQAKPTLTKLDRPRYCPLEDKIEIDSNKLDYECGWGCYGVKKKTKTFNNSLTIALSEQVLSPFYYLNSFYIKVVRHTLCNFLSQSKPHTYILMQLF
jgi:hypothetical protein